MISTHARTHARTGLYGERVGALNVVLANAEAAKHVMSQLKRISRAIISNPPTHGERESERACVCRVCVSCVCVFPMLFCGMSTCVSVHVHQSTHARGLECCVRAVCAALVRPRIH